jgi:DNA-binding NarL/FixJ family response regulator
MHKKIKVLIVDDHPVFRRGLREIIDADPGFLTGAETGDGDDALRIIASTPPGIAVIDLHLPGISGLQLVRACQNQVPPVPTIVLTMHAEESTFNAALDAGAHGDILKDNSIHDLILGLQAVAGGGIYISPSMSPLLLRRHQRASALKEQKLGWASLTAMERRILRLVAENKTNRQIGRELFISHRTVETHRRHLCEKLELSGPRALLQFALEHRSEL